MKSLFQPGLRSYGAVAELHKTQSAESFARWSGICLTVQSLFVLLPSMVKNGVSMVNVALLVLGTVLGLSTIFFATSEKRIQLIYSVAITGLLISVIAVLSQITYMGALMFVLMWGGGIGYAQKREILDVKYASIFLVSTVLLIAISLLNPIAKEFSLLMKAAPLVPAFVLFTINIYFIYKLGAAKQATEQFVKGLSQLHIKITSILTKKGSLENILWSVSEECIPLLDLEDCVIYLFNEKKNRLVQVAAYGDKSGQNNTIEGEISIEPGQGVVGNSFVSSKVILVEDTRRYPGYIIDDAVRLSELAVPIISNGKVVGVIDSEHTEENFFHKGHVEAFEMIASFCGIKIAEYQARKIVEIAEQAKAEADKYKELDELKNNFIANISHDLKTPLSLIKGPSSQIREMAKDEKVANLAYYIEKNADHLLRVVNQLLQLNRVDKGLNELYLKEIEVDELIRKIAEQYEIHSKERKVSLTVEVVKIKALTDTFRLEQIIHNIVHNAFRHTDEGGKIEIKIRKRNDKLILKISDTGKGMSEELKERVFDRFHKGDENNHEGTGIGLSLVKEYVSDLGGNVELKSKEGKGTTFSIELPLVIGSNDKVGSNGMKAIQKIPHSSTKPIMLVVEDHAELNSFICENFQKDFDCISVFDGKEALNKIEEYQPDIVITDLMMPNMDGNALISELKTGAKTSHIPVIVLSAKSHIESKIDLYNLGADNYLTKPFEIAELKAIVRQTLSERNLLIEAFRKQYLGEKREVETENTGSQPLLYQVVELVMEHLESTGLDLDFLVKKTGITKVNLIKEIKSATNLSPAELILSIRLNEAKKILDIANITIAEVAVACGFPDVSIFNRSFKKNFGKSPAEFRADLEKTSALK